MKGLGSSCFGVNGSEKEIPELNTVLFKWGCREEVETFY